MKVNAYYKPNINTLDQTSVSNLAKQLGIQWYRASQWVKRYGLPATKKAKIGDDTKGCWLIQYSDFHEFAKKNPELLGGIQLGRLRMLLPDEVAEECAKYDAPVVVRTKPVRNKDTGEEFASIYDAANVLQERLPHREIEAHNIQNAIAQGCRSYGYYWERVK